jgi:hypothetical protein
VVSARSRGYHPPRPARGRIGGLTRIALIVLAVIVATVIVVLVLFKLLDYASGGGNDPGGHLHIL